MGGVEFSEKIGEIRGLLARTIGQEDEMAQLPIVKTKDGKRFYVDRRLLQIRNVENPHDYRDFRLDNDLLAWINENKPVLVEEKEVLPPPSVVEFDSCDGKVGTVEHQEVVMEMWNEHIKRWELCGTQIRSRPFKVRVTGRLVKK